MTVKQYLTKLGACTEAVKWAGQYATVAEAWEACERSDWMEWLLEHTDYRFKAPALAEYKRATAPALAEYERVKAPAWAEYWRVKALASAEYERVAALAWAEYKRVAASALRTLLGNPFKSALNDRRKR